MGKDQKKVTYRATINIVAAGVRYAAGDTLRSDIPRGALASMLRLGQAASSDEPTPLEKLSAHSEKRSSAAQALKTAADKAAAQKSEADGTRTPGDTPPGSGK